MADASTISVLIRARDMASDAFKKVEANAGSMASGIAKHRRSIGIAMTAMGTAMTGFAVVSVKAASDLEESMNAVNVIFGDGAKVIHEFGENSARSVGLSTAKFNELASVTGALLKDVGLPMEEVAGLTNDLAIRAADMASVMNTSVEDALSAVGQALRGETEAIRRYAGDVTEATLQTFALSEGIQKQVSEMTEQEKRLLRVGLIMQQTETMAGDFANTSESLANRMRIAKAEFANVSAELGTALLPMVTSMVEKVQAVVSVVGDWIKEHPELAKNLMIAAAAVGGLMLVLGPLLLILPGLTVAFGLLTTVGLGPIGVAIGLVTAAIIIGIKVWKNWDTIIDTVKKVLANFTKEVIGFIIKLGEGFLAITKWIPGMDDVRRAIEGSMDSLRDAQSTVDDWGNNTARKLEETGDAWGAMEDQHHSVTAAVKQQNNAMNDSVQHSARVVTNSTEDMVHGWGAVEDAVMEVAIKQKESLDAQAAEQARHDALMKLSRESSQSLYRQELAEFVEGNLARQEALARTSASWDNFRQDQDATIIQLKAAQMDFADVVETLALQHGVSVSKMADDLAAAGVEYGDTMGLIEEVGRNAIGNVITEFGMIAQAADSAAQSAKMSWQEALAAGTSYMQMTEDQQKTAFAEGGSQIEEEFAKTKGRQIMLTVGSGSRGFNIGTGSTTVAGAMNVLSQRKGQVANALGMARADITDAVLKDVVLSNIGLGERLAAQNFANGGIVRRPTLGLVGEAGPEAVIPLNRAGGMGTNNFHFHGAVYGVEDLKEAVVEAVRDHAISGGFSGVFAEA